MIEVAFIGAGRMAAAMVKGLLAKKYFSPQEIACTCGDDPTGPQLAKATGIQYQPDLNQLLALAETVVLACKPQQLEALDPTIVKGVTGKLVLSILAGIPLAKLASQFGSARNLVRAMPNTPGQIGAGITAFSTLGPLSEADARAVHKILDALGVVLYLPEDQIDAVTAVSGSGPAYIFEFTAALRNAALNVGLSQEVATQLALETVLGAARLMKETLEDPETLRDKVTSPGGTTAAALEQFERCDLRGMMNDAVTAARDRSLELSNNTSRG